MSEERDPNEVSLEGLAAAARNERLSRVLVDDDEPAFELPGAVLSGELPEFAVVPVRKDEFTCSSCFLVFSKAALADPAAGVCRDCE
jgi:hypothetical protein